MANKIEYSRLVLKRTTLAGIEPTIATFSPTIIDESWLDTDILTGELFLNTSDDRLWARTDNGIMEIVTTSTYSSVDIWEDNGTEIILSPTHSTKPVLLSGGSIMGTSSVIKSFNGGGQLDLDFGSTPNNVMLSTDGGTGTETYVSMSPTVLDLRVGNGASSELVLYGDGTNGDTYLYASNDIWLDGTNKITITSNDTRIKTSYDLIVGLPSTSVNGEVIFGDNRVTSILFNEDRDTTPVVISSRDATIGSGVVNSSIVGGSTNDISNTHESGIFAGNNNVISTAGSDCGIFGGDNNDISSVGSGSTIIGGESHTISSLGDNNSIIGGVNGSIGGSLIQTVILGGINITANLSRAVYVPDLVIKKNHSIPVNTASTVGDTGSITWDTNYIYIKTSGGTGAGGWKRVALSTF